ncbi:hypothetical protein BDV12DRAFT_171133 [Aspergillus spectabilis]
MDHMNYHIKLRFADGLARFRRSDTSSPPADLQAYITRMFDYNLDERNPIGARYMLL